MILMPKLGKLGDKYRTRDVITIASVLGALVTYILLYVQEIYQGALLLILDFTSMAFVNIVLEKLISSLSVVNRSSLQGSMVPVYYMYILYIVTVSRY